MASLLSKLFKPKWQHASESVRIQAIEALDSNNAEHIEILLQLLTSDTSPKVRETALLAIKQPQILVSHYAKLNSADKQAALTHILKLSQQLGLSLFDMVEDEALIAEMIISSDAQSEFMTGLARLQDEQAIFTIACNAQLSRVRQAATELIESESFLQKLVEIARSKDKKVFQTAKAKINAIRDRKKHAEEQALLVQAVLKSLNEHANTDDTTLYKAKLENLKQRWQPLEATSSEKDKSEYQALIARCEEKAHRNVDEHTNDDVAPAKDAVEKASNEAHEELVATLNTLTDTIRQLQANAASVHDISAIDAIIKTQETRWIVSTKEAKVEKHSEKQYKTTMSTLRHYLTSLQKLQRQQPSIEQWLNAGSSEENEAVRALQKTMTAIDWPSDFAKPQLLITVDTKLNQSEAVRQKQEERQVELEQSFNQGIDQLDALLDEKQLAESKKAMQKLRKIYGQLNKKRQNTLSAALKLRSNQLNELRDWQGFAASPQQERLCEAMESLIDQHIDPQEKVDKIRQLQDEWKSLGGAQDQSLWERFSSAADKAFEPCAEFFGELSQLKKANLEKRQQLLAELSTFIEQNNWDNADWKAVEKINRQARNEWRDAYPVDTRASKALQKQFNEVLSQLDSRLNTVRSENLTLKEDIVARAQALSKSDDLKAAMQGAKALQVEWQNVGITEHKKDRALWKAFRQACDSIFEQRDVQRNEAQSAIKEKLANAASNLERAEQLANQTFSTLHDIDEAAKQLRGDLKQLNDLPNKERNRLFDQYNALLNSLKQQSKALEYQSIEERWTESARKASIAYLAAEEGNLETLKGQFASTVHLPKALEAAFTTLWASVTKKAASTRTEDEAKDLCIRCEIASGIESPESDKERRMQLQVSRLSEGLSGGASLSREEQLDRLLTAWYTEALTSPALEKHHGSRIKSCIQTVFGAQQVTNAQKEAETESA